MGTIRTIWGHNTGDHAEIQHLQRYRMSDWFSRLANLVVVVRAIMEKQDSRATLRELSDHQLRDIGITRRQAREESSKYFWS